MSPEDAVLQVPSPSRYSPGLQIVSALVLVSTSVPTIQFVPSNLRMLSTIAPVTSTFERSPIGEIVLSICAQV